MNNAQDLYAILGVSPTASLEDIRSTYRSLARRLHPDANSSQGAVVQFREISAAYEVLNDVVARDKYDLKRQQSGTLDNKPYFSLRVTPSKRVIPILNEAQVLYVLAELLPDRNRNVQLLESQLNLAIVIDHSLSMKGPRLERVKVATHQIIDQLTEKDRLSIVTFSDRAEVLVPSALVSDKPGIKAKVTMTQASGATEMFQGLDTGYKEVVRNVSRTLVNHIILITDGRTYGDEPQCLALADQAARDGIGISAMGIGEEWNDVFLDQLASRTGGTSEYINSPNAVVRFLNDKVRTLGQSFAERVSISLAPDPDIKIESAFRLMPNPQPVSLNTDPILIGQLQAISSASIILQLQIPPGQKAGFRSLIRIEAMGDIMREQRLGYQVIADTSVEVAPQPSVEEPPLVILDALGKLTLYRMQEKAGEALARGDIQEATRRLENLATRLLSAGQEELANAAMAEARRVSQTNMLSEEGHKTLKYGTRLLLAANAGDAPARTGSLQTGSISKES